LRSYVNPPEAITLKLTPDGALAPIVVVPNRMLRPLLVERVVEEAEKFFPGRAPAPVIRLSVKGTFEPKLATDALASGTLVRLTPTLIRKRITVDSTNLRDEFSSPPLSSASVLSLNQIGTLSGRHLAQFVSAIDTSEPSTETFSK